MILGAMAPQAAAQEPEVGSEEWCYQHQGKWIQTAFGASCTEWRGSSFAGNAARFLGLSLLITKEPWPYGKPPSHPPMDWEATKDTAGVALTGAGEAIVFAGFMISCHTGNLAPVFLGAVGGAAMIIGGGALILFEQGPVDPEGYRALFGINQLAKVGEVWVLRLQDPDLVGCEDDAGFALPGQLRLINGEILAEGANYIITGPLEGQICKGGKWESFTSQPVY